MITLARCQEMADQIAKEYCLERCEIIFNNRITRTWGRCSKRRNVIWLSLKFCLTNSEEVIYDLIKHEMAHTNPESNGHDEVFKETCRNMGISEHTFIDHPEAARVLKYEYECPVCHYKSEINVKKIMSCGKCCPGQYNEKYRLIIRKGTNLDRVKKTNVRRRNLR